ncbi:phosphatidate cytidylyltransferase [Hyphomicrobium denitrificans ATCC 51888]|uniref:Phosphatidate cytidylyltransferase n=1 Tax=Hyphomicrobium denitrificans (strain ATCC 51888 / DSM 1869 / NCIMB 11706 / TK 0415) TaxID=582899 RepID=D8JZB2_HYPDA|nr:phosphatidate cytidylyltransferase [Hyphomicrobium denitrificans]ADJ23714.1 phosphatidate cytidylyltransferase [Hyphomicrobium denitrificans ATCC 51888]
MAAGKPDDTSRKLLDRVASLPPELSKRIASGIVIGAIALAMTYWSPSLFTILMLVIAAAMSWEWGRMVRGATLTDPAMIVHVFAVLLAVLLSASDMAGLAIASTVIGAIAVGALTFGVGNAQLSGAGVLYTGLPVVALGWIRGDEPLGFSATLFVLLSVIVTDIGAYASGRTIGGPKLWPAVSPNKTWSGLLGGVLAASLAGGLFAWVSGTGSASWLAGLGLVLGLVAQGGDLAESALKRHFGVKDSSNLIPGHGGVMDRMDGIVTASVIAAIVAFAIDAYAPARALLYGS